MSSIRLEVGKKYRCRNGEVHTLRRAEPAEMREGYRYEIDPAYITAQGKVWRNGEEDCHDLVEEVVDPLDVMEAAAQAEQKASDPVNHPDHYTAGAIECIDAIAAAMTPEEFRGYLRGNAFKYLWRYRMKGGVESLQKAQWYLDRLTKAVA